jgi:nondiscriminating glutamyl-tRNA synthetase
MLKKPRVRFAPSPTGHLHVGNARTALFNWLCARHYEGTFVLRIEDTDKERTFREYEEGILEDLRWLGLEWDEGPGRNGAYGPYHQFERLDIYKEYCDALAKRGLIYPCYCTDEELEAERSQLIALRQTPRYTGRCRNLTSHERLQREKEGRQPAYRFRIEKGIIEFNDFIRGAMRFDAATIGDFIIVRSNGVPAYNFAVVVDDFHMKISHVIRGEDHLSNTALQLLLYNAMGFDPPRFAHHPLILGWDRSKLSKRHGSVTVREFREQGILPEALLNYLSLLGSSLGGKKEVSPLAEIIDGFTLERVGKSGAIFDEAKLNWLNGIYIRSAEPNRLAGLLEPYLREGGFDYKSCDKEWFTEVVASLADNLSKLSDIGPYIKIFFDSHYELSPDALSLLAEGEALDVIIRLRDSLQEWNNTGESMYAGVIGRVKKETGLKGKNLLMPIRAAVTGVLVGPELDKVFSLLPKESLLMRCDKAIDLVAASRS